MRQAKIVVQVVLLLLLLLSELVAVRHGYWHLQQQLQSTPTDTTHSSPRETAISPCVWCWALDCLQHLAVLPIWLAILVLAAGLAVRILAVVSCQPFWRYFVFHPRAPPCVSLVRCKT